MIDFNYPNYLNECIKNQINLFDKKNKIYKFLLVGAKGFIGKNLLNYFFPLLRKSNILFDLYLLSRESYYKCTLKDNKYNFELITGIPERITHLIHLAVPSTPEILENLNNQELSSYFKTQKKIDQICKDNKPYMIYFSSGAIFGRDLFIQKPSDYKENCIEKNFKFDPYTALKRADETHYYLKSKSSTYQLAIINLYSVLLPNQLDRSHFAISQFIKLAIDKKPLIVKSPHTLRSYIGINEIIFTILSSFNCEKQFCRYSLGSPVPISMIELAHCIADYYGNSKVIVPDEDYSLNYSGYYPKAIEINSSLLSISKISPIEYIHYLLKEVKIN